MSSLNDQTVVDLLQLVREQRDAIHHLRLMVGGLLWHATKNDPEKLHQFHGVMWLLDRKKPPETERDQQWDALLVKAQHELELGKPEIPS